jgi:transcriptional regulator with XRE-family HTH domain
MGDMSMVGGEYKHANFAYASTLTSGTPKLAYMGKLADRLIEAREGSGFSAVKPAAEKAGITPSALYQLEDGTTKSLRAETAQKLAGVYPRYRIEWLITGEGPKLIDRVNESVAAYGASHLLRIDPETIAAAIKLVRLSFLNLGLEIDQEENGIPLAYAYEFLLQRQERSVTAENVVAFRPMLERRLREQELGEEHGSEAGGPGGGDRQHRQGRKAS